MSRTVPIPTVTPRGHKLTITPGTTDDDDHDQRGPRRRFDAPPHVRVRKGLLAIAENPMRPWHEEVQSIANLMTDNYEDELLRGNFVDLVLQLALEQPLKTPFTAAVVQVANTNKPELIDSLLTKLAGAIEARIAQGEWRDVKLYLKLLACLQSLLEGDGVFPVLEELFSRAVDLQTASSEDVSGSHMQYVAECPRVRTNSVLDNWHRACQDHLADHSIRHGSCAW